MIFKGNSSRESKLILLWKSRNLIDYIPESHIMFIQIKHNEGHILITFTKVLYLNCYNYKYGFNWQSPQSSRVEVDIFPNIEFWPISLSSCIGFYTKLSISSNYTSNLDKCCKLNLKLKTIVILIF